MFLWRVILDVWMLIVLKIINLQQHRLNLMHYNKLVVLSQIVVLEHNLEYNQIYMTKYKIQRVYQEFR